MRRSFFPTPFSHQGLINSLDFSKTSEWTVQCKELLSTGASGLGLVFEDGVLKLDALIEKGHKYIESEKGTEFLRNAQKKALHFTKATVFEQASGYIQQLEKSEESKNSRALAFSFVSIIGRMFVFFWLKICNATCDFTTKHAFFVCQWSREVWFRYIVLLKVETVGSLSVVSKK